MAFEKYTVYNFREAWFNDNRSVLSQEEFDICLSEFKNISKLFDQEEFSLVSKIEYYNNRIYSVNLAIRLQRSFINEFDIPYKQGFEWFKAKGHRLFWDEKKEPFLEALTRIELKEKKYVTMIESSIKDLMSLRKSKESGGSDSKFSRGKFIRMINSLGKDNFKIDIHVTTAEDLAYMICQQIEDKTT